MAAGNTNVTLGTNGALSVALVPNAGATPAGSYYTVIYQLGPGEVKTEYWIVPTTSPANLATVRTTPGSGVAAQPVSMQYVNSRLATKANDNAVVHLNGSETIVGAKTFDSAPNVPAPTCDGRRDKGLCGSRAWRMWAREIFCRLPAATMTGTHRAAAAP